MSAAPVRGPAPFVVPTSYLASDEQLDDVNGALDVLTSCAPIPYTVTNPLQQGTDAMAVILKIRPEVQPKLSLQPDGNGGLALVLAAPGDPSDGTALQFPRGAALGLIHNAAKILNEKDHARLAEAMAAGLQPGLNIAPNNSGGFTLSYVAPGHHLDGIQLVLDKGGGRVFVQSACAYLGVAPPELPEAE